MPTTFDGVIETALSYFLGTDKVYDFTVYTSSAKTAIRDATNYTTHFMVKRHLGDLDADSLIEANGVVTGVFNVSPSLNTQKISVTLIDSDTDEEVVAGLAYWELKRTDDGSESVLAFGTIQLKRAVHVA